MVRSLINADSVELTRQEAWSWYPKVPSYQVGSCRGCSRCRSHQVRTDISLILDEPTGDIVALGPGLGLYLGNLGIEDHDSDPGCFHQFSSRASN